MTNTYRRALSKSCKFWERTITIMRYTFTATTTISRSRTGIATIAPDSEGAKAPVTGPVRIADLRVPEYHPGASHAASANIHKLGNRRHRSHRVLTSNLQTERHWFLRRLLSIGVIR